MTTLTNAGYAPFSTPSGKEAAKLAKERVPSLIILEILMPDMDGPLGFDLGTGRKNGEAENCGVPSN